MPAKHTTIYMRHNVTYIVCHVGCEGNSCSCYMWTSTVIYSFSLRFPDKCIVRCV